MKRFSIFVFVLPFTIGLHDCRAEEPAKPPLAIIRVKSLEGLAADVRYLAKSLDKDTEAKQFENVYKTTIVGQGIDLKKPWGAYGRVSEDVVNSSAVLMLPISDTKLFLKLLEKFNVKNEKDDDGIYKLTVPQLPVPVLLRFKDKYGYFTFRDKKLLEDKELLDAEKVLAGDCGVITVEVKIDQIPEKFTNTVLQNVEKKNAEDAKNKWKDDNEAQRLGHEFGLNYSLKLFKSLLREGDKLTIRFDIDGKADELTSEVSLQGKDDTQLAMAINDIAKAKSTFAGLTVPETALRIYMNFSLPEEFAKLLGEVMSKVANEDLEKEEDETQKEFGLSALKAIQPTLAAGEIEMILLFSGSSAKDVFSFVGGMKVKDGSALEKLFRDEVTKLPEGVNSQIKLDVEKIGSAPIHEIPFPGVPKDELADVHKLYGSKTVFLAITANVGFITAGPDRLKLMRGALAAKPAASPLLAIDSSLLRLMAELGSKKSAADKKKYEIAKEVFGNNPGTSDKVTLVVEGGKSLKIRFALKTPTLKFFERIGEQDKNSAND